MKTRVLLPILAMVFSVLLFSCSGRGQAPKAAVPTFFAEAGVPNDVARQAREIVAGRIARNLDFADKLEADIIIVGEIRLVTKDGIMDRFADRLRGNPAWFELEVQAVDAVTDEVVASFTGTFDARLRRLDRSARRLARRI
ncbi:MAG: hypothetical protein FWB78_04915 [Treponema sp.]|nr:hypothetical protein [Treponema sp.]